MTYKRLTRTVDLTGRSVRRAVVLDLVRHRGRTGTSCSSRPHEVGTDDWTTLPDANGHTQPAPATAARRGGWRPASVPRPLPERRLRTDRYHRRLARGPGESSGWQQWSIDLAAYAGKAVKNTGGTLNQPRQARPMPGRPLLVFTHLALR